jgi:hypothetical protein
MKENCMNKKWKITAILAVIMMAAVVSNGAAYDADRFGDSNQEATSGTSNTNMATSGLFSEDRDYYLDTTSIGELTKNLIFVNIFAPKVLGGDPAGGKINGFTYVPYFDAGAGFFLGSNWIGFAFNYGATEKVLEFNEAFKTTWLRTDGSEEGSTTVESAPLVEYDIHDGFKLAAIFGNKTWGAKNTLTLVNSRREGYNGLSGLSSVGISGTAAATALTGLAPSNPGQTITNQPGTEVTKAELSRGKEEDGGFRDEIEFGINLGDLVPVVANLSPWAVAGLNLGYWNKTGILDTSTGTFSDVVTSTGYGGSYSRSDRTTGTLESASYAEDVAAGEFDLGFALTGGVSLKLNDIFTLSPELGYDIEFPIYGNKYTTASGGEETAKGVAYTRSGSTFEYLGYKTDAPNPAENGPRTEKIETRTADVYELSRVDQNLAPAVKLDAEFGQLAFAIKYTPKFTFTTFKQTAKSSYRSVTTHKEGTYKWDSYTETVTRSYEDQTAEYDQVIWDNTIDIGAQVWLKPDKLRLNVGSSFTTRLGDWVTAKANAKAKETETTKTDWQDENRPDTTTTTVSNLSTGSRQLFTQTAEIVPVTYNLGFTYFFNENVNFDFLMKSQEDKGANWLELLLPATWALQFNIRY